MVVQQAITDPLMIVALIAAAVLLCVVLFGVLWWRSLRRRRQREERADLAEPPGGAPHWGRPPRSVDTGPPDVERPEPRTEPPVVDHPTAREGVDPALRGALDAVPGLGPTRCQRLVSAYPTLQEIRAADADELAAVEGIGPRLAERLVMSLRPADEVLSDLPGFGPARRARIAARFPTAAQLASAPVEAVAAVEGIGPDLARRAVDQAQPDQF